MSGPIRQKIGPMAALLKKRIEAIHAKLDGYEFSVPPKAEGASDQVHKDEITERIEDIDAALYKINEYTGNLQVFDQQWQSLILTLPEESEEYVKFITTKTDYVDIMSKGYAITERLEESRIKLIRASNKISISLGQPTREVVSPLRTPATSANTPRRPPDSAVTPSVQLPKLVPRMFDGKHENYEPWRSWFEVAIHRQPMPNLTKLLYLSSCMEKATEAERVVLAYEPLDENYESALTDLDKRFRDKKAQIRKFWKNLHSMPPLNNNSSPINELRQNYDSIRLTLGQLARLGEDIESSSIQTLIQQKWPPKVVERLIDKEMETEESKWNTTSMLKALDGIITRLEEIRSVCHGDNKNSSKQPRFEQNKPNAKPQHPDQTSAMFVGQANTKPSKKKGHQSRNYQAKGSNELRSTSSVVHPHSNETRSEPYCLYHEMPGHWSSDCKGFSDRESQEKQLTKNGRCTNCGQKGHNHCTKPQRCRVCGKGHNAMYHKRFGPPKSSLQQNFVANNEPQIVTQAEVSILNSTEKPGGKQKMLYVTQAEVFNPKNPGKTFNAIIVVDPGAEQSFASKKIEQVLALQGPVTDLEIGIFGTANTLKVKSRDTQLGFKIFDGSNFKLDIRSIDYMMRPIHSVLASNDVELKARHLEPKLIQPDILLGIDVFNEIILNFREKLPSQFWRQSTVFGPVVGGKGYTVRNSINPHVGNHVGIYNLAEPHNHSNAQPQLDALVRTHYELESLGIKDDPKKDADDEEAMKILHAYMHINKEGRIEVPLVWKKGTLKIPLNKNLAKGRFISNLKKYETIPGMLKAADDIIKEYLSEDIVEEVEEFKFDGPFVSYIPFHFVHRAGKSPRKVNDASASVGDNISLNENLYRGPSLIPDAAGFLMRFRLRPLVLIMDIQRAFLNIAVRRQDREVLRFIWLRDITKPPSNDNIIILRYTRLPFGLICAPFILAAAIIFLLAFFNTVLSKELGSNMYVDNGFVGSSDPNDLINKYKAIKEMFARFHMNMRDFRSNHAKVNEAIAEPDKLKGEPTKVLGIPWDSEGDALKLCLNSESTPEVVTKRVVMSQIAKNYDPLGYLVPALLPAKLFSQKLWRQTIDWDQPLSEEMADQWRKITAEWPDFHKSISRHISGEKAQSVQLHSFGDASNDAFGAAVFLRVEETEHIKSNILYARSHVIPLRLNLTIPKAELCGVLVACRALRFAETQLRLNIDKRHVWSDSTAVLGWIFSDKRQKLFVENRLKEIRSEQIDFRHVVSEENPADVASRGLSPGVLNNFDLWWKGPKWLCSSEAEWPHSIVNKIHIKEVDELAENEALLLQLIEHNSAQPKNEAHTHVFTASEKNEDFPIKLDEFSDFTKALRFTAWTLRLVSKSRNKARFLTPSDIEKARRCLLRHTQALHPPKEEQIRQLGISTDANGLLRCYGRLGNSKLSENAKNPYFLPKSRLAELIIMDQHERNCHAKMLVTLASIRENFWIPQAKRFINETLKKLCFVCRRFDAIPFQRPKMNALPESRLHRSKPFDHTGTDYFGPITIKKGPDRQKVWGVIYTCMVTRLTVLDIAQDLTAEAFLHTLRRLIARTNKPRLFVSDNASNFTLSDKTLQIAWPKEIEQTPKIYNYCAKEGIEWKMIVPKAAWMGGFYESLIKLTKKSLRCSIGRSILTYEELSTLFAEVQAVMNSRPLTFISENFGESKPIRPIDFLYPGMSNGFPQLNDPDEAGDVSYMPKLDSVEKLAAAIASSQKYIDKFWHEFEEQYLKGLREKQRNLHKQPKHSVNRAPRIGEIVLLHEEELPRASWNRAIVVGLQRSSDGEVRSVDLRTPNGNTQNRPVDLCFPLEIQAETVQASETKEERQVAPPKKGSNAPSNTSQTTTTPTRKNKAEPPREYAFRPREGRAPKLVNAFFITLLFASIIETAVAKATSVVVKCADYGINYEISHEVRMIKSCTGHICLEKEKPQRAENLPLEPQVLMYDHVVKTQYWIGAEEFVTYTTCLAKEFCMTQNCIFCGRFLLYMLQCLPVWLEILLFVLFIIIASGVYTFIGVTKHAIDFINWLTTPLQWIVAPILAPILGPIWRWFKKSVQIGRNYARNVLLAICPCFRRWIGKKKGEDGEEQPPLLVEEGPLLPVTNPDAQRGRQRRGVLNFPIWRQNEVLQLTVLCLLLLANVVGAKKPRECAEVTSIVAHENMCKRNDYSIQCSLTQTTVATIPPHDQTLCMLTKDAKGNPLETCKFRFNHIAYKCKEIIHHYTRKVQLMDESTKLCAKEGSCVGDWCAKVQPGELAPEFNGIPNQKPGFTYCAQGCSSWIFCGCITPTSACIPYRIYALEGDDPSILSVFKCQWEEQVNVNYECQANSYGDGNPNDTFHKTVKGEFNLVPGIPAEQNGMKMTMFSQIIPPTSLLNSYFVANATTTALLDDRTFEESKLFMCSSVDNAQKLRCSFPPEASSCHIAEGRAVCQHRTYTMDKVLAERHLPIVTPSLLFTETKKMESIQAEYTQQDSISVIIQFEDKQVDVLIDQVEIDFTVQKFSGCTGCLTGAEMRYVCISTVKSATVHVHCPSLQFHVTCYNKPEVQTVHLAVQTALMDEICEVRYPGGSKPLHIVAEFYRAELYHLPYEAYDPSGRYSHVRRFGRDWNWLWRWIFYAWWTPILIAVVAAMLSVILIASTCPMCLARCCYAFCPTRRPHRE